MVERFLFLFWGGKNIVNWDEKRKRRCSKTFNIHGIILNHYRTAQDLYAGNAILTDCNMDCNCPTKIWDPVCGSNGLSYMSACLAGCETFVGTGINMVQQLTGLFFFFLNRTSLLCTALALFNYELGVHLTKVKWTIFLKTKLKFLCGKN